MRPWINRAYSLGGFDAFARPCIPGLSRALQSGASAPRSRRSAGCPSFASGELVGAIAMSEPGTGSDLQSVRTTAVKKGNRYLLNGSKIFITNGQHANLIIASPRPIRRKGEKACR